MNCFSNLVSLFDRNEIGGFVYSCDEHYVSNYSELKSVYLSPTAFGAYLNEFQRIAGNVVDKYFR